MGLKKRAAPEPRPSAHDVLRRYSERNGYPATQFADAVCRCGGRQFQLALDDAHGAAVRACFSCELVHPIGDSEPYLDQATLEECACPCGSEAFEITAGVSLYEGSADVRWLYLACRCAECGVTAVYGDWKNEYPDYRALLAAV